MFIQLANKILRDIPTAQLYFLNIIEQLGVPENIIKHSNYLYEYKDKFILVRYLEQEDINILENSNKELIYIVDDDYLEIVSDSNLPLRYKFKIQVFLDNYYEYILKRASTFIVSNISLQKYYKNYGNVFYLKPYWNIDFEHIYNKNKLNKNIKLSYLATSSHTRDLSVLKENLTDIIYNNQDNISFHSLLGDNIPDWLRRLPNVYNKDYLSWGLYNKYMSRESFDIGLYPLLDTKVNEARSISKFFEYTRTGAVIVASDNWSYSDLIKSNNAGIILDNNNWHDSIQSLLDNRDKLTELKYNSYDFAKKLQKEILEDYKEFWDAI